MKISKVKLDQLIEASKAYYGVDFKSKAECKKLVDILVDTNENLGCKAKHVDSLIFAIVARGTGLKPDASHEDIYKILEMLGYEVTE